MPLQIIRQDITKMACDAIVNAANGTLLGGGGVDGMIHRAAGPELLAECRTLHGCETGRAKLTKGYRLPAKYVIHTVGPVWRGGGHGERELLASCYRASLELALEHGCGSVAFPLISAGIYGYPRAEALRVAADAISDFLAAHGGPEMTVYLVVYGRNADLISAELRGDVRSFLDEHYVPVRGGRRDRRAALPDAVNGALQAEADAALCEAEVYAGVCESVQMTFPAPAEESLEDALRTLDESFSQMLLRKIDERGMKDAECYKRANVDRKLFSKIRGDVHYRPSKATALAFAVALELPIEETRELLMKAGYALSRSSKFDVIVEYFIRRQRYDVFEINETLFSFDQMLLGSAS